MPFSNLNLLKRTNIYAIKVISVIESAELSAFASLTNSEQDTITDLWEIYTAHCIDKIKGGFR